QPPILAVPGTELDEREERVVLIEDAVGGEVNDALVPSQRSERLLRRWRADQHARLHTVDPPDGGDFGLRARQCTGAGSKSEHAGPRRRRRSLAQPEPHRRRRHVLEEIALDEELLRRTRPQERREGQIVELEVRRDEQAPLAREQAARLHWRDQLPIQPPERRPPGPARGPAVGLASVARAKSTDAVR